MAVHRTTRGRAHGLRSPIAALRSHQQIDSHRIALQRLVAQLAYCCLVSGQRVVEGHLVSVKSLELTVRWDRPSNLKTRTSRHTPRPLRHASAYQRRIVAFSDRTAARSAVARWSRRHGGQPQTAPRPAMSSAGSAGNGRPSSAHWLRYARISSNIA